MKLEYRRGPSLPVYSIVALVLVALGVLLVHAWSYLPFIADDALISLRYADRLLSGHGLTWTAGQRLEGYSNLLWVLACAGLGACGLDLITACRVLGIAGSVFVLAAIFYAHRRGEAGPLPWLAATLGVALSGSIAAWTVGGLEQPLLAALLAWALVLCRPLLDRERNVTASMVLPPGILLALLCWTRPDGALFTVGVCLGLVAVRGLSWPRVREITAVVLLPATAFFAQLAFRWGYYGDWLPNSARAKLAFTTRRWSEGLDYVGQGLGYHAALVLPAVLFAILPGSRSRDGAFLAPSVALWALYVVAVGGDLFPARRQLVPLVVMLALLLAEGLQTLLRHRSSFHRTAWMATLTLLPVLAVLQQIDPENRRARTERWEWDGQVLGRLLHEAFADKHPLIAVDAAGTLPYFSRLDSLDMLGINDRHLARNRPESFGHGRLGHELGDGAYVLDRKPDLVVFCDPPGSMKPCFPSGREMVRDPRFRRFYRPATLEGDDPYVLRSLTWFRAEDGKLGVRRDAERIEIPGYLLTATGRSAARLGDDGQFHVDVAAAEPAGYVSLTLPAGRWRLQVRAAGAPLGVVVTASATGATVYRGESGGTVRIPGPGQQQVDLLLVPSDVDGKARLSGVVFEKV